MSKAHTKDTLLAVLSELGLAVKTLHHIPCPTCEVHTDALKGTEFEKGFIQAKNLFFKVVRSLTYGGHDPLPRGTSVMIFFGPFF